MPRISLPKRNKTSTQYHLLCFQDPGIAIVAYLFVVFLHLVLIIETQASFIIQAIFKYYKWAHVQLNSKSPLPKCVPHFKLKVYIKNKNKQKRKKNLNSATVFRSWHFVLINPPTTPMSGYTLLA